MGIFLIKIVLLARGKIMKVAIFCDYLHSFGGTEYYNATLAMELKKRGIDVRVFICEKTQNSYWIDRLADCGIKTYEPARNRIDRDDRSVDYEFVDSFIDEFVSWSPDVIHASPAANLLKAFLAHKKAPKVPIVATEHTTPCADSAFWYPDDFKKLLSNVSCFVATCRTSAKGIKDFHGYSGPVKIVPHFIRPPVHKKATRIPYSVGCIARMSPEKGIGVLLVAWKMVVAAIPAAKLYLYGDGRVKSYFERLAFSLGLQNSVVFAGTYDPRDGAGAIAGRHDIFVQPSLFESIPTSLIELGMLGKPIVATNVGGIRELVRRDTGILVQSGSTDKLARAIVKLLSSKELQKAFAANIQKSVGNRYDLDKAVNTIIGVYRSVI